MLKFDDYHFSSEYNFQFPSLKRSDSLEQRNIVDTIKNVEESSNFALFDDQNCNCTLKVLLFC